MDARRAVTAAIFTLVAIAVLPGVAVAHSELVSSTPTAGETVTLPPTEIRGAFSEAVDPGRSTLELRGPDGARIATGTVPDGGDPMQMVITAVPSLAPGVYEVRWTTVTADDNGVERGTFTFTVAAAVEASAASTSSAAPTPSPVLPPAASPASGPTAGTGIGDVLIPILVLALVLLGGTALVLRRRL
jgi:copper resistance protein C